MGTTDGGFTWEPALEPTVLGDLQPIQAFPNGEAWVAGGGPDPENPFQIQAQFWHTTDWGENWRCALASIIPAFATYTTGLCDSMADCCGIACVFQFAHPARRHCLRHVVPTERW